jgi:hypothetical protein
MLMCLLGKFVCGQVVSLVVGGGRIGVSMGSKVV